MKIHKELLSLNEKVLNDVKESDGGDSLGADRLGNCDLIHHLLGYVAGVVKSSFALGGVVVVLLSMSMLF
jgi:hypothetical protein